MQPVGVLAGSQVTGCPSARAISNIASDITPIIEDTFTLKARDILELRAAINGTTFLGNAQDIPPASGPPEVRGMTIILAIYGLRNQYRRAAASELRFYLPKRPPGMGDPDRFDSDAARKKAALRSSQRDMDVALFLVRRRFGLTVFTDDPALDIAAETEAQLQMLAGLAASHVYRRLRHVEDMGLPAGGAVKANLHRSHSRLRSQKSKSIQGGRS